jgi:nucleoside-diphosphate-sugar epimerase
MNNESVIVTGATGFIGSHLVSSLISEGFDVHVIVRKTSCVSRIGNNTGQSFIHIYDGSIESLKNTFSLVKPKYVFHLASLFLAKHDDTNILNLLQSNIVFSTQLVEAMVDADVRYLINTGTSWQHYDNKIYNPVNLYAATKQAFETILEFYIQTSNLKVLTLKLFDTYGPNDPRKKILSLLNDFSKSGALLTMSAGDQMIDLVYIDDVIRAYQCARKTISEQTAGQSQYGVCSNRPITLKHLVQLFEEELKTKINVDWGKRPYRDREVMVPWIGSHCLPNWQTQISLEEGLLLSFG